MIHDTVPTKEVDLTTDATDATTDMAVTGVDPAGKVNPRAEVSGDSSKNY